MGHQNVTSDPFDFFFFLPVPGVLWSCRILLLEPRISPYLEVRIWMPPPSPWLTFIRALPVTRVPLCQSVHPMLWGLRAGRIKQGMSNLATCQLYNLGLFAAVVSCHTCNCTCHFHTPCVSSSCINSWLHPV